MGLPERRVIWKYTLSVLGTQRIRAASGRVVHVGMQGQSLCIWIEHTIPDGADDPEARDRHFLVAGTGHVIDETRQRFHAGSVQDGPFVWHVYEAAEVGY